MSKTLDINATTGEEIIRDMTKDEQADFDKMIANQINLANKEITNAAAKIALLERLGMTAEEAALLLS